jgi:hypothetical protein
MSGLHSFYVQIKWRLQVHSHFKALIYSNQMLLYYKVIHLRCGSSRNFLLISGCVFALYGMVSQLRIVSRVFRHSTDEDYIYILQQSGLGSSLSLLVLAAILSLKALHVSDLHKFFQLSLTNQFCF